MLNDRIKTNIAVTLSVATLVAGGYGAYKTNENISEIKSEAKKTQAEMQVNIDKLTKDLDTSNKEKEEKHKALDEANTEIDELKKQVEANKVNIKKLQATKLNQSVSRGSNVGRSANVTKTASAGTPRQITLTFYGEGAEENGGYAGIDAQGNRLVAGTVASNYYKFGTKISFNGQTFTVRDRGGSNFAGPNRLDVFVPRRSGESKSSYDKRISNYGKKTVTAYVF